MERIGEIFAYEVSKHFDYITREVITSLGCCRSFSSKRTTCYSHYSKSRITLHQGILNFFDRAQNAFVSAYRKHHKSGKFDIQIEYTSSPSIEDKILILSDPMLATGSSMFLTYKQLLENGKPKHTTYSTVIASAQGVEYLNRHISNAEFTLWVAAVDDELTAQSYIVPGLGDAGDLAYGSKL